MFGVKKLISGDSEGDNKTEGSEYIGEALPRQATEKKLKKARSIFNEVEQRLRDKPLSVDHRDEIVEGQVELLRLVYLLVEEERNVNYVKPEQNPSVQDVADFIQTGKSHLRYEYVDNRKVGPVVDEMERQARQLLDDLEAKPEFEYAYHERRREVKQNHEILSYGTPSEIDRDELPEGEDGEEVYACGRALEAMEEVAQDPSSPLWLGIGTRNSRDIPISKDNLFRHRAIFGQTGYGKSTLLTNDAKQLIESGAGMCFIDPKGDDSRRLMKIIPEDRLDDVVWIEPGATGNYLSGFNYITIGMSQDDPNYEVARANLVEDLTKMLKMSADYWGPRMDRVARNLITAMNMYNDRTPDDTPEMNLVDLYYILKSEASRKEFTARCKEAGLRFVDDYTEDIAEMSDDDLEPLLGRFQPWIENPVARRMIGFREGGVNIPKAIENNRIIIVRMGSESKSLKRMLGMAVIRRIWSHIRSRSEEASYTRKPFYLFADEFDNIALNDDTIPAIISESRSYRLSFNIANQYPSQLPGNVVDAITTNCDTIISFNPGDKKQARTYNTQLKKDPEALTDEVNYHVWLRTTIDEKMEKSDPFRAYIYPPHPPKRTMPEAKDTIRASLKKYGRERRSDEETYKKLLFNGGDGLWETGIGREIELVDDDDLKRDLEIQLREMVPPPEDPIPTVRSSGGGGSSSPPSDDPLLGGGPSGGAGGGASTSDPVEAHHDTILESIFATAIQTTDDPQTPVPTSEVKERLIDRLPDDVGKSLSELSNIFERLDGEKFVDIDRIDGEMHASLTPSGEAKVFERDTGTAGSGGGDDHRWVLRESYTAFTKIGYETWLPQQDGGELPDGVADAPIDVTDVDDSLSGNELIEEIENQKDRLKQQYPEVWKLSGADDISIEAETSTLNTPFQTFNNLNKAKRQGNLCVFALKDESADKGEFDYWGRRAEHAIYKSVKDGRRSRIIEYDPVWRKKRPDEHSEPRYYTYASGWYKLDEDKTALRPVTDSTRTVWYKDTDTGEIVAAPANNETLIEGADEIRFEDADAVEEGDPTAVPAYYEYDQSEGEYVVNASGEKLYYATREEMEEEWETFRGPWIPENEFDEMPDEDDFMLVIFPDADNDEYDQPQIYEHGECKPLFDTLGIETSMPEFDTDIEEIDADDLDVDDDAGGSTEDDASTGGDSTDTNGGSGENTDHETEATPSQPDQQTLGENRSNSNSHPTDSDDGELVDSTNPEAAAGPETPAGSPSREEGGNTRAQSGSRPEPTNIKPYELSKSEFCEIERGRLNTIASGMILPQKGSDEYDHLIDCIRRIDQQTAEYIESPQDLPDVIGNAQQDRSEENGNGSTPTSTAETPASTTADTAGTDTLDETPTEPAAEAKTGTTPNDGAETAIDDHPTPDNGSEPTTQAESSNQPTPAESELEDSTNDTPVIDPTEKTDGQISDQPGDEPEQTDPEPEVQIEAGGESQSEPQAESKTETTPPQDPGGPTEASGSKGDTTASGSTENNPEGEDGAIDSASLSMGPVKLPGKAGSESKNGSEAATNGHAPENDISGGKSTSGDDHHTPANDDQQTHHDTNGSEPIVEDKRDSDSDPDVDNTDPQPESRSTAASSTTERDSTPPTTSTQDESRSEADSRADQPGQKNSDTTPNAAAAAATEPTSEPSGGDEKTAPHTDDNNNTAPTDADSPENRNEVGKTATTPSIDSGESEATQRNTDTLTPPSFARGDDSPDQEQDPDGRPAPDNESPRDNMLRDDTPPVQDTTPTQSDNVDQPDPHGEGTTQQTTNDNSSIW